MKKIIVGILVLCCFTVCLVGCGNKGNLNKGGNDKTSNVSGNEAKNNSKEKYFIKINNKKIEFPCKFKKFEDIGYTLNSNDEANLQSSSAEYEFVSLQSDDLPVIKVFIEPGKEDVAKLTVIGFLIPLYAGDGVDIEFNGLIRGQSTLDDVLSVFGNPEIPKEIDKTEYTNTLSYKGGRLIVSTEDNKFSSAQYIGVEDEK